MIDKVLAGLATLAGVVGYYLATVTDWCLILAVGLAAAALGAGLAFIGVKAVRHRGPDLAAGLIQGWRITLFVLTALSGTVAGVLAKTLFPDPNVSALAFIVAFAVPALGTLSSGVVEKYSTGWFAYHFLAPYRGLWPSLPAPGKDKGREAWNRANSLPPTPYNKGAWTLQETQATLEAFKAAIEVKETTA